MVFQMILHFLNTNTQANVSQKLDVYFSQFENGSSCTCI